MQKSLIQSRIEFPDPMLMTLDRGKITFSPLWFLILKLYHNSGLHSKIREKFHIKIGRLLWSLGGRKCGKRGGGLYKEKGKCNIESRIEFTVPKLVSLDMDKVFEKCPKNAGKI